MLKFHKKLADECVKNTYRVLPAIDPCKSPRTASDVHHELIRCPKKEKFQAQMLCLPETLPTHKNAVIAKNKLGHIANAP